MLQVYEPLPLVGGCLWTATHLSFDVPVSWSRAVMVVNFEGGRWMTEVVKWK
jgi:hypothetical protein